MTHRKKTFLFGSGPRSRRNATKRTGTETKIHEDTALESHVAAEPTISAKVSAFTEQANSEMSLRGSGQVCTSRPRKGEDRSGTKSAVFLETNLVVQCSGLCIFNKNMKINVYIYVPMKDVQLKNIPWPFGTFEDDFLPFRWDMLFLWRGATLYCPMWRVTKTKGPYTRFG